MNCCIVVPHTYAYVQPAEGLAVNSPETRTYLHWLLYFIALPLHNKTVFTAQYVCESVDNGIVCFRGSYTNLFYNMFMAYLRLSIRRSSHVLLAQVQSQWIPVVGTPLVSMECVLLYCPYTLLY